MYERNHSGSRVAMLSIDSFTAGTILPARMASSTIVSARVWARSLSRFATFVTNSLWSAMSALYCASRSATTEARSLSDFTATTLFAQFSRLASATRSYNLTVTNVPGPPQTVRLLGARMQEVYPLVPLFAREALGIALFSYDGGLFWGFDADWDALPDLHDLVGAVQEEFERLQKLEAPRQR